MSEYARVDSVDSLKDLRVSLCKFAETVRVALDEADAEIQRTSIWLKQEQHTYWKREILKRTELVTRAKIELKLKQNQKTPLGGRYSCVDERKALAIAKKRYEEAKQKHANVRRWIRQLDQEAFSYKGVVQGLSQTAEAKIPNAIAQLDNMVAALESYASVGTSSDQGPMVTPAASESLRRPGETTALGGDAPPSAPAPRKDYRELREQTPSPSVRDGVAVDKPKFRWPKGCAISESQRDMIANLDVEWVAIKPGDKVVIARGSWDHRRICLERMATSTQGDSGWYVGFADDAEVTGYAAMRVADLLADRSDWDRILQLPAGYLVVLDGMSIEAVLDPQEGVVWPPGTGARQ